MKRKITITLAEKILKNVDSIIDFIYIRNRSQAVEYLIEKTLQENKTAVILATGPSDSLRIGRNEFRSTAKIANTSVIEQAIFRLRENGFKRIFIVGEHPVLASIFNRVGDGKHYGVQIKFFEDFNPPGTAESLRLLKGELNSTFLVVFGDIIFSSQDIKKLWGQHLRHRGIVTVMTRDESLIRGGVKVPVNKSALQMEGDLVVKAFPKPSNPLKKTRESNFILSAMFVAEPEIFSYTGNWIENEVLPAIAEKRLLYACAGIGSETHIHSQDDLKLAAKTIANISKSEII